VFLFTVYSSSFLLVLGLLGIGAVLTVSSGFLEVVVGSFRAAVGRVGGLSLV